MSVLSHYRDHLRGWGSSQDLSFSTPPPLTYSPRAHWSGLYHYMAHASTVEPNPEIYEMAMEGAESSLGVGMHEARHWHRHAYGGLMGLARLSPAELGHAAAYEAFRYLLYHEALYEPLADEVEREREVLLSLAIAEATRLYEETPRFVDEYGLQTACSSAAATASLVYSQQRDMAELGPEYLSQRNAGRQYGNAYVEDDAALLRRAGLERGRFYGRSTYSTTYGGRGGRALSEGRSLAGPAGIGGMGVGSAGVGGASMAGSRDPRTLASPLAGGTDSPPYPVPRSTFSSMPGSPIPMGAGTSSIGTGVGGPAYGVGEASLLSPLGGVNPCSTVTPGTSPYPAAPGDPSYSNGAGGFVSTAGVPDVQPAGSSVTPGLTMNPTVNAAASMPLSAGAQASYPASNAPTGTVPQPLYGGASAAMPQAAYTNAGAPGTMPQTSYGGAPGVTSQAVHGSASLPVSRAMPGAMPQAADGGDLEPVSRGIPGATSQAGYGGASLPAPGAMPGALPGALPQAVYGGVPQPVSSGLPGAMPQAPYAGAPPPISGQAAYAGAQVYPPGSTIVLPSHKKRHRRRARSRDLEERDRYYRARRARDGYESH